MTTGSALAEDSPPAIMRIAPTLARRLAIHAQRLDGPLPPPGPTRVLDLLRQLRCLQLDPISVVARSHTLVLWSRLGHYAAEELDRLLWRDRQLFEYWAHCASLVLAEDLPIHHQRMLDHRAGGSVAARYTDWLDQHASLRDQVLATLRERGPLSASAFEDDSATDWYSTGWTAGRTVNQLLQTLWVQGVILVAGRKGTARLWDLAERVLPALADPPAVAEARQVETLAVEHALRALGIANLGQIRRHFVRGRYPNLKAILAALVKTGAVVPVAVDGDGTRWPGPWYVHSEQLPALAALRRGEWEPRVTLLSPFDNLICDRARLLQFFDFDYTIEIYVPPAKRHYGYYALPILYGDRIVGCVDLQRDRKAKQLIIKSATLPAHLSPPRRGVRDRAISRALADLATFVGATDVVYPDAVRGTARIEDAPAPRHAHADNA